MWSHLCRVGTASGYTTTSKKKSRDKHVDVIYHTFAEGDVGDGPKVVPYVRRDNGALVLALIGKADIVVVAGGVTLVSRQPGSPCESQLTSRQPHSSTASREQPSSGARRCKVGIAKCVAETTQKHRLRGRQPPAVDD